MKLNKYGNIYVHEENNKGQKYCRIGINYSENEQPKNTNNNEPQIKKILSVSKHPILFARISPYLKLK